LPKASGRQYYECDINYQGGYRGAERIVYSNDGLIFYSADITRPFSIVLNRNKTGNQPKQPPLAELPATGWRPDYLIQHVGWSEPGFISCGVTIIPGHFRNT
jgi:hypothetical protein